MKTYVIETFGFTGKLSDIYLFLDFALSAMDEPAVQKKALAKWMNGVPEFVRDKRFVNRETLQGTDFEAFAAQFEEGIKESYLTKFRQSKVIVLNLSLVMMCTILELFFEHVLSLILRANSKTLLSLSKDKSISLEQLLRSSTYEGVLEDFIKKTTEHIIRQGTMEILKTFRIVGIRTELVFSWEDFTDEVQDRLFGWDDNKLNNIFSERHSIVHDNALPLQSVDELLVRKEFFEKLILNISVLGWKKFYKYGVILDSHDMIRKASGGNPETYVPQPPKHQNPDENGNLD
jgi:hypothetical protein